MKPVLAKHLKIDGVKDGRDCEVNAPAMRVVNRRVLLLALVLAVTVALFANPAVSNAAEGGMADTALANGAAQSAAGAQKGNSATADNAPGQSMQRALVLSTGAGPDSAQTGPLADGIYYLQASHAGTLMLDVAGASKTSGANVWVYAANKTAAQQWKFEYDGEGAYTISSVASGLCLDLQGGIARVRQNVRQWQANGTPAQKWRLVRDGDGWRIVSAKDESYCLDVAGAGAANGTNVRLYTANGTGAQRWWIRPAAGAHPTSQRIVDNGVYELRLASSPSHALDLAGAAFADRANVRLWSANGTIAQRWALNWGSDGYYTVTNVSSGKALEVAGALPAARANVVQQSPNGSDAQRWAVERNADGSYAFINKAHGLVLDIQGAKAANGTNAQVYLDKRSTSQRFQLEAVTVVPEGVYTLYTRLAPESRAADIPGASQASGVQGQIYAANGSMAQKFQFRRNSDGSYAIQNSSSGLYLSDESGKVVQRPRNAGSAAQHWQVSCEPGGLVLSNAATGKRLALASNSSTAGTKLVTATASTANAQRWRLRETALLADGWYTLKCAGGKVLDVSGGSLLDRANIKVYTANGTSAQRFLIKSAGNGLYTLSNDRSAKVLDVAGGSKAANANVQQYASNGSDAQKWRVELAESGGIVFINKGSGLVLDAAGAGKANGANVRQATKDGNAGQRWILASTRSLGISGNAELDNYLRRIVAQNSADLYKCYTHTFTHTPVHEMDSRILGHSIQSDAITTEYALMVIRRNQSDCYGKAALFTWLARACGYSASFRAGGAWSASAGEEPHGWTEVYRGGRTYVCDPSLGRYYTQYNWFMITYENAHTEYVL